MHKEYSLSPALSHIWDKICDEINPDLSKLLISLINMYMYQICTLVLTEDVSYPF